MRETPYWVITPQRLSRFFRALVDVAGLTPRRYASKEAAAYAIYLVRNKLSPPTDVIVLSAPSTTEQIK